MASKREERGSIDSLPELSTAEINEYKEWFEFFDKDGNGKLDFDEFKKVMYAMGFSPTDEELKDVWAFTDADGNGHIDQEEYLALLRSLGKSPEVEKAELIEAFRKLDKNKSNSVSRSKMKRCFEVLHCSFGDLCKEDLNSLLDKVDTDGNGMIDIEEFVTIMMEKPSSK